MAILFKNYPQGFGGLFATQAFFNFGFYGLKSIFILYIVTQLSLSEREAIGLFATLMALSYATSILGGWIADKGLGIKNTIVVGGLLQAVGIACLMFPSQEVVLLALSLISLGSGFFKPNLSTSVGMLFENPQDPQKDKAYSTYYVAMNLGGLAAPLLCGFMNKTYGGYYNSLLLIVVTLLGGIYLFYQGVDFKSVKKEATQNSFFAQPLVLLILIIILLGILYLLFKYNESFDHLMGAIAIGSILYLGKIVYQCTPQERRDVAHIILYIVLFTLFCALFEQAGSSLMLFFDKAVDRRIMGMELPSTALLSLGPIFVLIFGPFLVLFCGKILEKKKNMDGLIKIGIGFLLTGLSFWILALGCYKANDLVSPFWVVGSILVETIGELLIVPIGFSNISRLAPPRFRSVMMSFWLMAIAYGHYFGGFIAELSLSDPSLLERSSEHYQSFFSNLALMPCIIGLGLFFYCYVRNAKESSKKKLITGN